MPVITEIQLLFGQHPKIAREKLYSIRKLIYSVANDKQLGNITESIKYGEASYSCSGSTPIRIDWKSKHPESVSIYVNCQTTIIETIHTVLGEKLELVGNREIKLKLDEELPKEEVHFCIDLALRYHSIKHLPMLGIE